MLALRGDRALSPFVSVFAGLRYVRLIADEDGVEGGVLDGQSYENLPIVSELTSEYFGLDVGAGWRF